MPPGFNNLEDAREERVRTIREIAEEYLESYRLRNSRFATFAEYAVGDVTGESISVSSVTGRK